ncbi:MAG: efflux RND transporter periplasmic adaptor subunit [Parvularculaceae bacterium]
MNVSPSAKIALGVLTATAVYFAARAAFREPPAETVAEDAAPTAFSVIAKTLAPEDWRDVVTLRGETQAVRKITARAETAGAVVETPTPAGATVAKGDLLCRLDVDARAAALAEARAALDKARLDHGAAARLAEEGFRSATSLASAKAARDLAEAGVRQAEIELQRTRIEAPFSGVFERRAADVGDVLAVGGACGTVLQTSPFLVVGAAPERDVARIAVGDAGRARLATGETVEGVVRYVAAAAAPVTRTFKVELEVDAPAARLRDGVTATIDVFAKPTPAHRAPRAALTLNDEGAVGVRIVDANDVVRFRKVRLLGEEAAGVWLGGLDGDVRVITRGQEYVRAGEKVAVVDES